MADWYFRNRQSGLIACPGCRNLVRAGEEFCPYCAKRLGPEQGIRGWLKKTLARNAIATRSLIGLVCAVFVLQSITDLFMPGQYRSAQGGGFMSLLTAQPLTYILMGSNFHPFVLAYGQVWRFVTSCFLHFGIIHILFNCWAFWDLGRLSERFWGAKQVFAAFILSGIVGSAGSFFWHTLVWGSPTNSAGASGAICGLLGLLLGAYYKDRRHIGEFLGSQLIRWAVLILVFGLVAGADNGAHVGGLLAGGALGFFLPPTTTSRNPGRDIKIWNMLAVLALVLTVAAFIFAAIFYIQGFDHLANLLRGF